MLAFLLNFVTLSHYILIVMGRLVCGLCWLQPTALLIWWLVIWKPTGVIPWTSKAPLCRFRASWLQTIIRIWDPSARDSKDKSGRPEAQHADVKLPFLNPRQLITQRSTEIDIHYFKFEGRHYECFIKKSWRTTLKQYLGIKVSYPIWLCLHPSWRLYLILPLFAMNSTKKNFIDTYIKRFQKLVDAVNISEKISAVHFQNGLNAHHARLIRHHCYNIYRNKLLAIERGMVFLVPQ